MLKYPRGLLMVESYHRRETSNHFRQVGVIVFYGSPGTGKTRAALGDYSTPTFILDAANGLWWDGYAGQDRVVIDDFYGWIKLGSLLRILDGHPLRLEVKGGFTHAEYTEVIITSNMHPEQWYTNISQMQRRALRRRLSVIMYYPDELLPPVTSNPLPASSDLCTPHPYNK